MTTRGRRGGVVVLLACATAAGCASPPAVAPPAPPAATSVPAVAPGSLLVDGAVRAPATLDAAALARMPQADVAVTFQSAAGSQTHQEHGVPLAALLPASALAVDPGHKNDQLSFGVLGVGTDDYRALVSYGEVSPDVGNRGVLVSLAEDGRPLPRPRLVVPGDVKGGRYVSDLVELRVVHPG